jgi:hypothetical protein
VNKSGGPPYLIGVSGPDIDDGVANGDQFDDEIPPVPPMPAHRVQASFVSSAASYNGSIATSGKEAPSLTSTTRNRGAGAAAGGYVDILDASGALKPSDFKMRIQATGARDYGEDVADRNMGVNGTNLHSPAVIAFYALSGGKPLAYQTDGSAVDVHGTKYAPDAIPAHLKTMEQDKNKDELLERAQRTMRRKPNFPTRTTSLEPRMARMSMVDDLPTAADMDKPLPIVPTRPKSVHGRALSPRSRANHPRPLSMHPVTASYSYDFGSTDPAEVPDIPRSRGSSRPSSSRPDTSNSAHNGRSSPWGRDSTIAVTKRFDDGHTSLVSDARDIQVASPSSSNYGDSDSEDTRTPRGRTSFGSLARKGLSQLRRHRGDTSQAEGDGTSSIGTIRP